MTTTTSTTFTTLSYNTAFGNYGDLDLYSNTNCNANTPLVVFIHGGAWRSEDKKDHEQIAIDLVQQGFTVAMTNYRLSLRDAPDQPPEVQHPSHIQDTHEALTFLHNEPTSTYDKNKVFLVGHSAGAHIATMLLLEYNDLAFVRGVIGADGIYDLPLLLHTFPTYLDFISQAFGNNASAYHEASPISKRPSSFSVTVPVLIVHSMEDQLIDLAQAHAITQHLQSLNVNVTLDTTSVKGDHYDMIKSSDFISLVSRFVRQHQ